MKPDDGMNNILVTRPSMPDFEEYIQEIRPLWDTRQLTNMGPKHDELQEELKHYLEVENLELLVNGHMSLELTLQTLNLQGEVITTPFTFISTTHAIVRNGLTPVFCDIDPGTYTMDAEKIGPLITDRTCAIMPVHVYGNICDIEEIERIADKYELKVIYDAAHAFGETYKGTSIASFGDASVFSFHATKVFNTIEGGAVCLKDPALVQIIKDLKNFGFRNPEEVSAVGANAKMNEFCAAMGICNLRHLKDEIEKRKRIEDHYRERLKGIDGLRLNIQQENVEYNHAYFPVLFYEREFGASRAEVIKKLGENNIWARKYFYPLTSMFSAFHGQFDVSKTPIALSVSKRVLTLPIYADLAIEDVDRICDVILSCRG